MVTTSQPASRARRMARSPKAPVNDTVEIRLSFDDATLKARCE
jgi:hypothetical protein